MQNPTVLRLLAAALCHRFALLPRLVAAAPDPPRTIDELATTLFGLAPRAAR